MQNFDLYQFSSSGHSDKNKTTRKFNRRKMLPAKLSQSTVGIKVASTKDVQVCGLENGMEYMTVTNTIFTAILQIAI